MRRSPSQPRLDGPSQSIDRSGVSFIPNLRVRHRVRDRRHHIASASASAIAPAHLHSRCRRSVRHYQRACVSTPPSTRFNANELFDAFDTRARARRVVRPTDRSRLAFAAVVVARGAGNRTSPVLSKIKIILLRYLEYEVHGSQTKKRTDVVFPRVASATAARDGTRRRRPTSGLEREAVRDRAHARATHRTHLERETRLKTAKPGRETRALPLIFARERSPARRQPKRRSLGARVDARDERG